MVGEIIGYARLRPTLAHTTFRYGAAAEIAGRQFPVLDRNERGDCMCSVEGKGLVRADARDVDRYVDRAEVDPLYATLRRIRRGADVLGF